jgi:hypothetical protein
VGSASAADQVLIVLDAPRKPEVRDLRDVAIVDEEFIVFRSLLTIRMSCRYDMPWVITVSF